MVNTTIGEKDRFIGRIYSKELTVLINGNRFVSVKKKKKYWRRWRERETPIFHFCSFIFPPFLSLP